MIGPHRLFGPARSRPRIAVTNPPQVACARAGGGCADSPLPEHIRKGRCYRVANAGDPLPL
ncbi:hypothetical protein GQ53DRAFT_740866 [Thozetella sp. PMI_491]|nr:hypothetical protein GQ53DRAFT_740866 [Thozetella sp. PMI_491]